MMWRTCFAVALLAFSPPDLSASPIPIEAFARAAEISAPAISPNGQQLVYLSYVRSAGSPPVPRVVLLDLRTKVQRAILAGEANDFRVTDCWFKTDERLLCRYVGVDFDAGQPFTVSRLYSLNTDGSGGKVLVQNRRGVVAQAPTTS